MNNWNPQMNTKVPCDRNIAKKLRTIFLEANNLDLDK